ncbi:RDD family protein [Flagellimonas olearia]|uniref:RDD domain-containing protein n=1 Tax=Flagellimonas olearia TaxID=552546 RepID=A0A444VQN1_9FLAO|nr:RDD family protein [Allomuricauda olearia]RYC52992.1 hypothetical protein DN53_01850 [Allomuricauda olearia]
MKIPHSNISNSIQIVEASKKKRFFNYLIDTMFCFLLAFVIQETQKLYINIYIPEELILILTSAGYYILMEFFLGKTVGKHFTKTRVVDLSGKNIDFRTSMVRYFCRWIPFETFSLVLGGNAKAWHDVISKTLVVEDKI